jgi:hypothetical protein
MGARPANQENGQEGDPAQYERTHRDHSNMGSKMSASRVSGFAGAPIENSGEHVEETADRNDEQIRI